MTTDSAGFNQYFVYDKVGRLVGEISHRGSLIEYRYDANDRLLSTVRYVNAISGANLATLANPDSTIEMSTSPGLERLGRAEVDDLRQGGPGHLDDGRHGPDLRI